MDGLFCGSLKLWRGLNPSIPKWEKKERGRMKSIKAKLIVD